MLHVICYNCYKVTSGCHLPGRGQVSVVVQGGRGGHGGHRVADHHHHCNHHYHYHHHYHHLMWITVLRPPCVRGVAGVGVAEGVGGAEAAVSSVS